MSDIDRAELIIISVFCLLLIAIQVIPLCKISGRIGHSAWWGLITLFPFVGLLIWSYYVAYAKWPVEEKSARSNADLGPYRRTA
jgi:hypothetical protein